MKKVFLAAMGATLLTGCAIDTSGILTTYHNLPIDEDVVRVEVRALDVFRIAQSGDIGAAGGEREGELATLILSLNGISEGYLLNSPSNWLQNDTTGEEGDSDWLNVNNGDEISHKRGVSYIPERGDLWINARRGSTVQLRVTGVDVDSVGRSQTGSVVYEFTLPVLPDELPDTCGPTNSVRWINVDGVDRFPTTRSWVVRVTSRPRIRITDGVLCFKNAVER